MLINLRNIFLRMELSQQDLRTLNGVISAIVDGRKGPASGGVLNTEEAGKLRALLAEHGLDGVPANRGPVRGLSKMLRRNTTQEERDLWKALNNDRRFAGQFKRHTPVGPHIADFVSFARRLVIELLPVDETDAQLEARAQRRAWYAARNYCVHEIAEQDFHASRDAALDALAELIAKVWSGVDRACLKQSAVLNLVDRDRDQFVHLHANVGFGQRHALGGEVAQHLAHDIGIARFLEIGSDDFPSIGIGIRAALAELFGDPQAEQLVAPRLGLEAQFLVMGEFVLKTLFALVECRHSVSRICS